MLLGGYRLGRPCLQVMEQAMSGVSAMMERPEMMQEMMSAMGQQNPMMAQMMQNPAVRPLLPYYYTHPPNSNRCIVLDVVLATTAFMAVPTAPAATATNS